MKPLYSKGDYKGIARYFIKAALRDRRNRRTVDRKTVESVPELKTAGCDKTGCPLQHLQSWNPSEEGIYSESGFCERRIYRGRV